MLVHLAKAEGKIDENSALARRPKLTAWQQGFMDAFNTLSSSRTYTMAGAAAIPYPFIILYMNEHKVTDLSDREEFVTIVQAIDNAYLKYLSENKPK